METDVVRQRPDGIVAVDKPAGWTSHDVVAKARGLLGTRKVGHAGTLDPSATGVLVLGVGRGTRLLRFIQDHEKKYVGEIVLGVTTTTLDAEGDVLAERDPSGVSPESVRSAAAALTGDLMQVPPMVSAVKVGGRRLHELAREGVEIERSARAVHVARFDVEPSADAAHVWRASVTCSSGTYVRVLAADLGEAVGCGAHLRALRRTAIGPFTLERCVALEALTPAHVEPLAAAVDGMEHVVATPDLEARVRVGAVLDVAALGATGAAPCAVLDAGGALLAVYGPHRGDTMKPQVVIAG
jgi:tRNA pseudouridine55 synthase